MSEYDDPEIEQKGLKLQDAFGKISKAHELWPEYQELLSNPELKRMINVLKGRRVISYGIDSDRPRGTRRQYSDQAVKLQKRLKEIATIFRGILKSKMVEGELVGFGKPENRYAPYVRIPSNTVRAIRIKSRAKSTLQERGQPVLYDVRLFKKGREPRPIGSVQATIPSANLNQQIEHDGLSLEDAFDKVAKEHWLWDDYIYQKNLPTGSERKRYFIDLKERIEAYDIQENGPIKPDSWRDILGPLDIGNVACDDDLWREDHYRLMFERVLKNRLSDGDYVGCGRRNSYSADSKHIPKTAWDILELSYRDSSAKEDLENGAIFYDVQIIEHDKYPPIINAVLPDTAIISPAISEIRTASLAQKMSIDACVMDYFENNKSDFDKVKKGEKTQKWLAGSIADKYNRSVESVARSLRDPQKSPLRTEY